MLLAEELSDALPKILIFSLALIVLIVIGFVGVSWYRNRLKETDTAPAAGFTLSDLRKLHKSGQMTDEEYERAKAKIIAVAKAPVVKKEETTDEQDEQR